MFAPVRHVELFFGLFVLFFYRHLELSSFWVTFSPSPSCFYFCILLMCTSCVFEPWSQWKAGPCFWKPKAYVFTLPQCLTPGSSGFLIISCYWVDFFPTLPFAEDILSTVPLWIGFLFQFSPLGCGTKRRESWSWWDPPWGGRFTWEPAEGRAERQRALCWWHGVSTGISCDGSQKSSEVFSRVNQ